MRLTTARGPTPFWLVCVLSVVGVGIGVGLLIGGANRYHAGQPVPGGSTVGGTIASVATGQNCGRGGCTTYWVPTISFTAANGQTYTFTGPEGGEVYQGQTVQVSYEPSNPTDAHDLSAGTGSSIFELLFGALIIWFVVLWFVAGFERVHRKLGLTSARDGTGWVGHRHLHSMIGVGAAMGVVLIFAIIALTV